MSASHDNSKLLAGFAQMGERARAAAVQGVDQFSEHLIGDSQQMTPVATGFLAGSGTTLPAEINGNVITKQQGHNASYAAAVHENPDAKHAVGQWKYLETALRNNAPKFPAFVADAVRKAL